MSSKWTTGNLTFTPPASGGGVTDHGDLTGLNSDDHAQYLNESRGDTKYYTKAQVDTSLGEKVDRVVGKGLSTEDYTTNEKTKLASAAAGATANQADAYLLARANHTGTQTASTISDFDSSVKSAAVNDTAYSASSWDAVTDVAPSKNAVRDQIETMLTSISGKEPSITAGTNSQYWRGDKSWQTLDKSAVGLSNVPNVDATARANHTGTQAATTITEDSTHRFVTDTEKTTWNAKEGAITAGTTAQYWRGDKSWQTLDKSAVGLSNVPNTDATARANHTGAQLASTISDFASTVLATILTGLSTATSTVVSATDSILIAIGKLQAQVSLRLVASSNLSDLGSASTARTNLGLGTLATQTATGTPDGTKFLRDDYSWAIVSGSIPIIKKSVFTGSGTFTTPATTSTSTVFRVTVVGGGGNGGLNASGPGGGGGGGAAIKFVSGIAASTAVTVTVGGATGTSSFGAHCSATGGTSGASNAGGNGGAGGVGSSGDLNIRGQAGAHGTTYSGIGNYGGMGGSSILGGGGSNGNGGTNSTGGGGGGVTSGSASGASGCVIVEWVE